MSRDASKVLVIDDDRAVAEAVRDLLAVGGFEADIVVDISSLDERARYIEGYDLVVVDWCLPETDGLSIIRSLKRHAPEARAIVMTGYPSVHLAVEAMKAGASDFVAKPFDGGRLLETVKRVLEEEISFIAETASGGAGTDAAPQESTTALEGRSRALQEVFRTIRSVANTDVSVLIQGETGTGKERVARAIHVGSRRWEQPFLVLDCADLPETLLESTLFGREKGALTGAAHAKPGLLELAHGGTLLLDEVGELPLHLQARLLQVIQEQRFYRVGGVKEIRVDLRFLATTHRNLEISVHQGTFREDLYYRLKVITVEVPPLRQRSEDIPILARVFLEQFLKRHQKSLLGIAPETMECLNLYSWPGNVRQLENVIERAVVLAEGPAIRPCDLPIELTKATVGREQEAPVTGRTSLSGEPEPADDPPTLSAYRQSRLKEIEGEYALRTLRSKGGNVAAASRVAGISARSFYRLLDRCGVRKHEIERIRHSTEAEDVSSNLLEA